MLVLVLVLVGVLVLHSKMVVVAATGWWWGCWLVVMRGVVEARCPDTATAVVVSSKS